MRSIRWMTLVALVTAGLLAFAACTGGDDDGDDDGGGDNTPAASNTASNGGNETAEPEPTEEDDGGGNGGGDAGELQDLAEKFAEATFKAVYELGGTDATGLTNGQITIYKDGTDKIRFDIKSEQDGEAFEGSFIQTGSDSYLCFSGDAAAGLLGEEAGAGLCIRSEPDSPTNPVGSLVDEFRDIDVGNVEIQSKEDATIAGEDGTCYTVLDKDTSETTITCFNDDGVLLSVESSGSGGVTFTATSVEGEVSDGDFEPPYEIQDIPGLGG